jgi:hypothetical protein
MQTGLSEKRRKGSGTMVMLPQTQQGVEGNSDKLNISKSDKQLPLDGLVHSACQAIRALECCIPVQRLGMERGAGAVRLWNVVVQRTSWMNFQPVPEEGIFF